MVDLETQKSIGYDTLNNIQKTMEKFQPQEWLKILLKQKKSAYSYDKKTKKYTIEVIKEEKKSTWIATLTLDDMPKDGCFPTGDFSIAEERYGNYQNFGQHVANGHLIGDIVIQDGCAGFDKIEMDKNNEPKYVIRVSHEVMNDGTNIEGAVKDGYPVGEWIKETIKKGKLGEAEKTHYDQEGNLMVFPETAKSSKLLVTLAVLGMSVIGFGAAKSCYTSKEDVSDAPPAATKIVPASTRPDAPKVFQVENTRK